MAANRIRYLVVAAFALMAVSAAPALAAGGSGGFVTVESTHGYAATVGSLQKAVKQNGLMVMGKVNQKGILAMTGLHLAGAESFLVGNPRVGKKLFSETPAAAAVVPARISVWADGGHVYVGYFKPSTQLAAVSGRLGKAGSNLDAKFAQIVRQATR